MELKELQKNYVQAGTVVSIFVRPNRLEAVRSVDFVMAEAAHGLEGDHYDNQSGSRQVTLIQQEHLDAVASFLGKKEIDPALSRRNIVVKGINLISFKEKQFKIGEAVFEYSGECHPCSRMEAAIGNGAYNAMRGHGGITAKVIAGGIIKTGDPVRCS